ncbi:DUF4876 domain-containing protein [Pseudenhygromyxa sp. WMMC2535]|uniref:DUF4876 domain-containing protein n=1 Tax=Pseudenhygromyxa sp. WMMC2535 TaxID=2712867 RepID=UPI001556F59B|nr:DUF4876 domain-containing protein [Pseudenhygromyxa sp. WMMC2535]NVB39878.1 DUF4876 domain-containing protein [Pseudenhygromyxa sp. WMMC2535]
MMKRHLAFALILVSGDLACAGEPADAAEEEDSAGETEAGEEDPEPSLPSGRLVIDEVYFTGSPPAGGADHYYSDQFIALRNISDEPVAAGGLLIGDVFGLAGEINAGDQPNALADDEEHVYMQNLWRIPGEPQDVVIEPGARLLIAQDGVNHSPFSSVDLSGADFETYVAESGQDEDSPTAPNLELLHYNAGYDWLITVFGPSVAILSEQDAAYFEHEGWTLVQISSAAVIDAVDIVKDGDSEAFKRLPQSVDRGFTFASGTYTGEAVVRRRVDGQSIDTDDSSADFELSATPTPWR